MTFGLYSGISSGVGALVSVGSQVAAVYYLVEPFSPTWELKEAVLPHEQYRLNLKMKLYSSGGVGEAGQLFAQRAKALVAAGGFTGYTVLEYTEGMESGFLGSRRVAQGIVAMNGERTIPLPEHPAEESSSWWPSWLTP
jgi:hypothetical protein